MARITTTGRTGARVAVRPGRHEGEPDAELSWWVLADPEGDDFCAFRPRPTQ
ncbi:hypothetical protein NLX85_26100 [Micromonospora sp. A3M-1-15]|nr:hypothetical protein [Micromonospora sp. A3M-1-15]